MYNLRNFCYINGKALHSIFGSFTDKWKFSDPKLDWDVGYASKSMTLSETSLASELRQTLKELLAGSGLLTALS